MHDQWCQTLCNTVDCNSPGSSVHEIIQARILEWVAIFSCRGSFLPRDWNFVSCISSVFTGRFFTAVPPGKPMFGSVRMQKWIQGMVPHSSSPHGLTQPPVTHQGFCFWPPCDFPDSLMRVQAFVLVQCGLCPGRWVTNWVTWKQSPACSVKLGVKWEPAIPGQALQMPI